MADGVAIVHTSRSNVDTPNPVGEGVGTSVRGDGSEAKAGKDLEEGRGRGGEKRYGKL